ncbi:MAG: uroporphyrinogen-III C-methyltransferase [Planctomycetota bacterium]|jgi:uroporphyrin-III C-methyltransferase
MALSADKTNGKVYLVGAGPGRADLITVRGAELLRQADCIIYDRLANPALLKFARADAELVNVGKRAGEHPWKQPDINRLLVQKAAEHEIIVRLKGGDPTIFGRAAEELTTLVEAGVDFEIVPGVTAATAAAAFTGIMLTDREYSSQVIFVTGQEAPDKQESNIDWGWLAKFGGTIVFYMGVGKLDSIAKRLIEGGMKQETPVAVITNATFPDQRTARRPTNAAGKRSGRPR